MIKHFVYFLILFILSFSAFCDDYHILENHSIKLLDDNYLTEYLLDEETLGNRHIEEMYNWFFGRNSNVSAFFNQKSYNKHPDNFLSLISFDNQGQAIYWVKPFGHEDYNFPSELIRETAIAGSFKLTPNLFFDFNIRSSSNSSIAASIEYKIPGESLFLSADSELIVPRINSFSQININNMGNLQNTSSPLSAKIEYWLSNLLSVRAGYVLTNVLGLFEENFTHGFLVGSSFALRKTLFDLSYQFAFNGTGLNSVITPDHLLIMHILFPN